MATQATSSSESLAAAAEKVLALHRRFRTEPYSSRLLDGLFSATDLFARAAADLPDKDLSLDPWRRAWLRYCLDAGVFVSAITGEGLQPRLRLLEQAGLNIPEQDLAITALQPRLRHALQPGWATADIVDSVLGSDNAAVGPDRFLLGFHLLRLDPTKWSEVAELPSLEPTAAG